MPKADAGLHEKQEKTPATSENNMTDKTPCRGETKADCEDMEVDEQVTVKKTKDTDPKEKKEKVCHESVACFDV